jgi:hypothetical protein
MTANINDEKSYDEDGDNQVSGRQHEWDITPHVILDFVPATDIQLGDVLMGGAYQVETIGMAEQRGKAARRFDLHYLAGAWSEELSARLVVPSEQRLMDVKRYTI